LPLNVPLRLVVRITSAVAIVVPPVAEAPTTQSESKQASFMLRGRTQVFGRGWAQ
jgi:hypothetical protein